MIKFYDILLTIFTPFIKFISKIGFPPRRITGKEYYELRDEVRIGTVLLSKQDYELSNLFNPTEIKHAALYVGNIKNDKVCYVLESTLHGSVLTDLVSFLTNKDVVVVVNPKFIRSDIKAFEASLQETALKLIGRPYDYLFNKDGKAFYCFEIVAVALKNVYSELSFKCEEIVKGKRIYSEKTFLDEDFFTVIFDSRNS